MALPTPVNGQITDAVTQSNVTALGSAPSAALANLTNAAAQAFGLMMENAVTIQQSMNMVAQAATAKQITSIGSAIVLSS
ncbi:MAG TPA: RebB family R body protein [Rhizomicrobium sp.]